MYVLYVQKVVTHFIYLLYKMDNYLLDTQYEVEPGISILPKKITKRRKKIQENKTGGNMREKDGNKIKPAQWEKYMCQK